MKTIPGCGAAENAVVSAPNRAIANEDGAAFVGGGGGGGDEDK